MAHIDLSKDFSPASREQWLTQIEKDLKGKDFNDLISTTAEGLPVMPIYHKSGQPPTPQAFRQELQWDTVQEVLVLDVAEANRQALQYLNQGATALLFYLEGHEDLAALLKDVQIEYIKLHLVTASQPARLAQALKDIIGERSLEGKEIEGTINHDPLENLARSGQWFKSEEADFSTLQELLPQLPANYRGLCLNVNLFANGGATLAQQLGVALAMAYETAHRCELKSLQHFWLNFAVGSDYFAEIAKLRATRRLWDLLADELGWPADQPRIYCESSLRNKTIKDHYNNMIRSTSEAMAAVIGGADDIAVKGFDLPAGKESEFGQRIARNQSAILQHESHLDAVKDIARGSYFIEELTEALAGEGWSFFKAIESRGGFVSSLKEGWLQAEIGQAAQAEQKAFDDQQKVLIGANKYANGQEELPPGGIFHRAPKGNSPVAPLPTKRLSEALEQ